MVPAKKNIFGIFFKFRVLSVHLLLQIEYDIMDLPIETSITHLGSAEEEIASDLKLRTAFKKKNTDKNGWFHTLTLVIN